MGLHVYLDTGTMSHVLSMVHMWFWNCWEVMGLYGDSDQKVWVQVETHAREELLERVIMGKRCHPGSHQQVIGSRKPYTGSDQERGKDCVRFTG